ncbi:MAG: threonine synthase [Deltaproteobacteria bacterium]|nr:threonine synthase [Deltaproteobacteria bacterium]
MRYISTRGGIAPIPFKKAVMMGLATDGGLLLPQTMPRVDEPMLASWRGMTFPELSHAVLSLFIDDIPRQDLKELIDRSYASFSHPEVTPLVKKGEVYILELFHGPTLAFKDVALQFLGNVFDYLLKESGEKMNILGATSGDTGSAAIYGVRGKERINIFIIHPHKRVSAIQELQMTTVTDANVFNVAIRGTFDDGQAIVKTLFNDIPFKQKYHLGAVNSINWARILAQVVYYVHAALKLTGEGQKVDFSVPTGNFGDIFAGFLARKLLPGRIRNLVLATNENDLLTRFVAKGEYSLGKVVQTSSPSMDIQVASNFERYLYFLYDEDAERTSDAMALFARTGSLGFSEAEQEKIRATFLSETVSREKTLATIRDFFQRTSYVLDPHTAVGVGAALAHLDPSVPMVCLATAHPAKFGDAVQEAIGRPPDMPESFRGLENRESRCRVLDADGAQIKAFIENNAI